MGERPMDLSPAQWDIADADVRIRAVEGWIDSLDTETRRRLTWVLDSAEWAHDHFTPEHSVGGGVDDHDAALEEMRREYRDEIADAEREHEDEVDRIREEQRSAVAPVQREVGA